MNCPCNGEAISEIQTSATPSPLWDNNIGGLHLPLHKDPYKKTYPERPSGSLAVLRDAQFHDNNKVWNELGNSVWLLGHHVTMAWIMQHHIEVRISLNPWTQSSSVFPSAKELAVFILCCPINKNYSPLHCWLRTCCIQSTSSTRSLFANVVALGICIHLWIFTYFL